MPSLTVSAVGALAATMLAVGGGCASAPPEAAADRLDPETGTTLERLERPIELVATQPRPNAADPFAFAAPFVTDRMGARTYFVWIGSPGDLPITAGPSLYCDGAPVAMRATGPKLPADVSARPYERPAPWTADAYFELDAGALRALGDCTRLAVTVRYGDPPAEVRFEGTAGALRAFVAHVDPG